MSADEIYALLQGRAWVKRRVDRVEFLDLMTVRRTIYFTIDFAQLAAVLAPGDRTLIPLGWFAPWANAGAVLIDGDGHVTPYLTREESDLLVQEQIKHRLVRLGLCEQPLIGLVEKVRLHRQDPGIPGYECKSCRNINGRYSDLICEKWGCQAVRELLTALHELDGPPARELAQILLSWQTNFVLMARVAGSRPTSGGAIFQLSFDEELREWEPPWERHVRALRPVPLTRKEAKQARKHISRSGPFQEHLDALSPRLLRGMLARGRCLWLRSLGRRGFLGLAWHVAWNQASSFDAPSHQVDVILPGELMAVRMRLLRTRDGEPRANLADQVGSRATIVAPKLAFVEGDDRRPAPPPPPTLFSLVITQRSPASWYGGVWIALLSSIAIFATALWWMPRAPATSTDAITILIVAPTLVAALLSARARSDIAEQLTKTLRRLIGAVGVVAAGCAISLIAHGEHGNGGMPVLDLTGLRVLWVAAAILLLCIASTLAYGAYRIQRLIAFGRRSAPRTVSCVDPDEVFKPNGALRVPPPDRWLAANEGEMVPWGWLDRSALWEHCAHPPLVDRWYWQGNCRADLVRWVQDIYRC